MPDYSNAKIYKLVSDKTDMIYIGSTVRSLKERLVEHKRGFTKNIGFVTSKKLYELGGNISIELIKLFPCDCRKQLEKEEGKYIIEYKNKCVNICVVGRTLKEYYIENKSKILKEIKKYQKDNKENIKEYNKKYNKDNKENIKEYNKKYYKNNKEKSKKRYENNKEKYVCILW
jgi:N12 class adenine-specific DNA methylase